MRKLGQELGDFVNPVETRRLTEEYCEPIIHALRQMGAKAQASTIKQAYLSEPDWVTIGETHDKICRLRKEDLRRMIDDTIDVEYSVVSLPIPQARTEEQMIQEQEKTRTTQKESKASTISNEHNITGNLEF